MPVTVRYFARMAESAGCASETLAHVPVDAAALFAERDRVHGFGFSSTSLRVAINDRMAQWTTPLQDGDEICLIPPVSGG